MSFLFFLLVDEFLIFFATFASNPFVLVYAGLMICSTQN